MTLTLSIQNSCKKSRH